MQRLANVVITINLKSIVASESGWDGICLSGESQSPVNLENAKTAALPQFNFTNFRTPIKVKASNNRFKVYRNYDICKSLHLLERLNFNLVRDSKIFPYIKKCTIEINT